MRFPKKVVYLNIVLYILFILMIIISTTQVLQIKNIINISLFIISVFALLTYLSVSFSLKNIFLRLKETEYLGKVKRKDQDLDEELFRIKKFLISLKDKFQLLEKIYSDKKKLLKTTVSQVKETETKLKKFVSSKKDILKKEEMERIFKILDQFLEKNQDLFDAHMKRFESITDIREKSIASIDLLEERIRDIEKVVDAVKKITSQAKLIAFNAAIESSKAGEAGKGFSVVVTQIKNLIEDIEETAEDMEGLLKEIKNISSDMVIPLEVIFKELRGNEGKTLKIDKMVKDFNSYIINILEFFKELSGNINTLQDFLDEILDSFRYMEKEDELLEFLDQLDSLLNDINISFKDMEIHK